MSFDSHVNFAVSLIATAPTPAASGTTFSVTAGEGALFPAVSFNAVVWPAGANPTAANAEVVRVTSKGTGDNWTVTRTQESSSARSIAVGDQICAAITAKMLTDIETAQAADAVALVKVPQSLIPGGRLTLTTGVSVTTTDVTAAGTLYYTPHIHDILPLYDGSAWAGVAFSELSISIPATTSSLYDVFVYNNSGTPTLELLVWSSDTARATALVRQNGHLCKTGALTRLYLGSVRTTGSSGQTEDSLAKRYLWNYFNRKARPMRVLEATDTWSYTTNTLRQANAATTNQLDFVVGVAEDEVEASVSAYFTGGAGTLAAVAIGLDSTSAADAACCIVPGVTNNDGAGVTAELKKIVAEGRHTLVWLEKGNATSTATWQGDNGATGFVQSGIHGRVMG